MVVTARRTLALLTLAASVAALPAAAAVEWPGLRGPNFDGSTAGKLFGQGGPSGLSVGWKRDLGSGYSAIAVGEGKVITMFADGDKDVIGAFDVKSGDEVWRHAFADTYVGHDGSHDGPISTPLIHGGSVYALGPFGHLFAVDLQSGKQRWMVNLVEKYEAKKPHYGFSTSPVIADGVLVVEMGAEGKAIAGFDPANGELKWTAGEDAINYQSPIVTSVGGKQVVMAIGDKMLWGIDARSGEALFAHEHGGDTRAIGSASTVPVPAGNGRLFLSNKTDGATMLRVSQADGVFQVEELWATNAIRGTYVTPVYHDGHLYGMSGRIFTCVNAETGEPAWKSREPGDGFPIRIGEHIAIITKPGSLHVIEASTEAYKEVARLDLFTEHSWSEPAFAGGHLFLRSMNDLARVDLSSGGSVAGIERAWLGQTEFGAFLRRVNEASDKTAVVDAFMEAQHSFPIVEGADVVHFVYRGDAKDVGIVGDVIGFRREDPMTPIEGTDLFYYSTRVEPNASATYGFIVDYEQPAPDPLNDRKGTGLFGEVSWFDMPARGESSFLAEAPSDRQGKLEEFKWESPTYENSERTAQIYLPAGYSDSRAYPVLYVHGGTSALDNGKMKNALDNLIGDSVEPLIAVFVAENQATDRDPQQYNKMVVEELVPAIDGKYSTIKDAGARATVGAAQAGSAALMSAVQHPEVFGRMGGFSLIANVGDLKETMPSADERPMVMYLDWGTYHLRSPHEAWDFAKENREIWQLLRDRGYRPAGGERPEGFGWACWRDHADEMLAALFPKL